MTDRLPRTTPHPEERPQGASRRVGNNTTGSHPSKRARSLPRSMRGALLRVRDSQRPHVENVSDQVLTSMTYCLFTLGFFLRSQTAAVSAGVCCGNFSSTRIFLSRASPI